MGGVDAVERQLARVPEVARYLNVSRSKVYQMMDSGQLRYIKLGKSRRLCWRDVKELVEANTVAGSAPTRKSPRDGGLGHAGT